MRPLYHPKKEEMTVEGVLYALADPVRVQIFMQLASAECAKNCSTFQYMQEVPLAKSTLSQHFKVLREAGLIMSERKGVELHNRTRCTELQERFGDMVLSIVNAYGAQQKQKKPQKKRKKPRVSAPKS
ncbi:MAG: helix-turn-helix domain-containing protein [Alphaproteobacteria bacterium]|nr:helix-turn-helix domain-containing protein [Alphaproteobacteria bacterium]